MKPINTADRRIDLDWLRIITVLCVFLFHCGLFFRFTDWHMKNQQQYMIFEIISNFMMLWIMPVIFSISASASIIVLRSKTPLAFLKDKIKRLFIPLVFGIFVLAPPQVYLEKYSRNAFLESFLSFYPHYFDGMYGFGGNFAWFGLHLWYLLILLMFTVIFMPLLLYAVRDNENIIGSLFGKIISMPFGIFIPGIMIGWLNGYLNPEMTYNQRGFGGWPVSVYMLMFIFAVFLHSNKNCKEIIYRNFRSALLLAAICTGILVYIWIGKYPEYLSIEYTIMQGLCGYAAWSFIIGLHGLFLKRFSFKNKILSYANEAVLPFYIIHQTVIIVIGYFIVMTEFPVIVKYLLIIFISFILTIVLYEFAVRRWSVTSFLFGMKI